mmetsp:Transcript_7897/g.23942  ORF Transcript_7897/g.23942 Transcript_7897/m.23942 type:complete len:232 (-) Transcript_7897:1129-1824(-)
MSLASQHVACYDPVGRKRRRWERHGADESWVWSSSMFRLAPGAEAATAAPNNSASYSANLRAWPTPSIAAPPLVSLPSPQCEGKESATSVSSVGTVVAGLANRRGSCGRLLRAEEVATCKWPSTCWRLPACLGSDIATSAAPSKSSAPSRPRVIENVSSGAESLWSPAVGCSSRAAGTNGCHCNGAAVGGVRGASCASVWPRRPRKAASASATSRPKATSISALSKPSKLS